MNAMEWVWQVNRKLTTVHGFTTALVLPYTAVYGMLTQSLKLWLGASMNSGESNGSLESGMTNAYHNFDGSNRRSYGYG